MLGKWLLVVVAVVSLAAWAGIARADGGQGGQQGQVDVPTFEEQSYTEVKPISPLLVPRGGIGTWPGDQQGRQGRRLSSAKAYSGCWYATSWRGPTDGTGYAHINGWMSWCGNGFWITYAAGGEYGTQSGWYSVDAMVGPWWSGGGIGGFTVQMTGYINWSWHAPLIGLLHSGNTWMTQVAYASGYYTA